MHLESNLLLTAETLHLEPGLVRGRTVRGALALKRVASGTYLLVNELQARVLDEFTSPRNVPDALESCIRQRICPPLREFYDLILKAHHAGVLRSEELDPTGPAPIPRPAVRWFVPLPPAGGVALAGAGAIATLVALALWLPAVPRDRADFLRGWLAVCGALSAGHLLAASALRGAGCEVHRPRLRWLTLAPHFAVELEDRCMAGRMGRAAVLALTILPLGLATAAGLWRHQPWVFPPLVALFFFCRPIGDTVTGNLLLLLRREPVLATDGAPLFDARLSLVELWRVAWRRFDLRVTVLQFALGIGWALGFSFVVDRTAHLGLWQRLLAWPNRQTDFTAAGIVAGGVVAFWIATSLQYRVIDASVAAWRRGTAELRRWRAARGPASDPVELEALIRRNPLLRRLDPDVQAELVGLLQPLRARPWRKLVTFDETPATVGFILTGRATVYQRLKSGRKARFFGIIDGDLFGAHKLVDPHGASLEVRTNTPVVAVTLGREDFQRLVVDTLGVPAVCRYVHNHLFLHRAAALCADWRPAAIARFAELATTATHSAGGKIILQGQEVGSLHVLYEGQARALKDRKPVARLRPGDFFGEISLLQTSAATADVETTEDTSCLVVNRVEFIRFISRNQHVALQLERLCSKRLGHPIFPLDHQSFDVR